MLKMTIVFALLSSDPLPAKPAQDITAANAAVIARYYPRASIRRGEEGAVEFRVVLNREGKIESCAITRSSGFVNLDDRTCDLMVETARFAAIRDASGWRARSVHDGRIVWRIPDDQVPDTMAAPNRSIKVSAEDRIVCRRQLRRGSLYVVEKICLSAADWRRQREYSQGALHAMQSPGGPIL